MQLKFEVSRVYLMLLNELDLPPKSACESLGLMFGKSEIVRLGFSFGLSMDSSPVYFHKESV